MNATIAFAARGTEDGHAEKDTACCDESRDSDVGVHRYEFGEEIALKGRSFVNERHEDPVYEVTRGSGRGCGISSTLH